MSMRFGREGVLLAEEWIRTLAQAFEAESGVYDHHGLSIALPGVRCLGRSSPSSGVMDCPPRRLSQRFRIAWFVDPKCAPTASTWWMKTESEPSASISSHALNQGPGRSPEW